MKISLVVSGSLSTLLFGGAASLASALKATSSRIIVEPSVLKTMSLIGAPFLLARTYNKIVMEKDLGANALKDELSSNYIRERILNLINRSKKRGILEEKLVSMGLNREEAFTAILALSRSHDRVFISRPFARIIMKDLGLKPSPPLVALVDSLRKGIIRPKEFSVLYRKLFELGDGR